MATTADAVTRGFHGYSGIFTQRRKYDYSDQVVFKSRYAAKMFNMLSRNLTKMAVTELEPRIFEYTEENDVFEIDNNPGTAAQIDLADADAQLLQAEDRLAVLIKSVTAAPSQETVVVESVGAIGSGGSGTGYTAVTVRRGSSPINMTPGS